MSGHGNRLRRKAGIVWIPASFLFAVAFEKRADDWGGVTIIGL